MNDRVTTTSPGSRWLIVADPRLFGDVLGRAIAPLRPQWDVHSALTREATRTTGTFRPHAIISASDESRGQGNAPLIIVLLGNGRGFDIVFRNGRIVATQEYTLATLIETLDRDFD